MANRIGVVADDFPRTVYNEIFGRMNSAYEQGKLALYGPFHDSWLAVAYRFLTCAEHDTAFQASIQQHGSNVPQPEHYVQERELFGFFVSGLASIESLYYSCYALAALLDDTQFPMANPKDINPSTTAKKFIKHHPHEALSTRLDQLRKADEYKEWRDIRNVVAHRVLPPREASVQLWPAQPNPPRHDVTWTDNKILLDANTTASRRAWLADALTDAVAAVDTFTATHFS